MQRFAHNDRIQQESEVAQVDVVLDLWDLSLVSSTSSSPWARGVSQDFEVARGSDLVSDKADSIARAAIVGPVDTMCESPIVVGEELPSKRLSMDCSKCHRPLPASCFVFHKDIAMDIGPIVRRSPSLCEYGQGEKGPWNDVLPECDG